MFYLPIYTRFGLTQELRNSVEGERVSLVDSFVVQALVEFASAILYIKTHIKQYKIVLFLANLKICSLPKDTLVASSKQLS